MKTRTRIASLLLAWLVLTPIAVLAPTQPASAAPLEERSPAGAAIEAPTLEFGERLSASSSRSAVMYQPVPAITHSRLPVPEWQIWPGEDLNQVVNLNSFMMITDGFEAKSWCICLIFFNVRFQSRPIASIFEFTETDTGAVAVETCALWGNPWAPRATDLPCQKEWDHSSDVTGMVEAEARVMHFMLVSVNGNTPIPHLAKSRASAVKELQVGEVLNVGQSIDVPVLDAPVGGEGSGFCSVWGISVVCWVGEKAVDAALAAIYAVAPFIEEVINFFKGCGDAVLEQLGSLVDIARQVQALIDDPEAFVNEKLQEFKDLIAGIREDPVAFAQEVLGQVLDLDRLDEEGFSNWIGATICNLAIEYFTGKAGARILQETQDWLRHRRNNPDPDPDRPNDRDDPSCRTSSFPAETLVLMADGTHQRIDQIRPGDWVISHDLDTSVWEPSLVVDQWSHLDRGPPSTVTLTNQSTVTATDDHLFWRPNASEWTKLRDVRSGDQLATPHGVVDVDHVTTGPRHEWTVWELTVVHNHNFTVVAGDDAVLVHNAGCQPNPTQLRNKADETRERLARDGLDITAKEFQDAWADYLRRHPDADFDTWQGQYENIRRNNHLGNQHEADLLRDKYGITNKQGTTFDDVDGGQPFKPDAIVSTDPPHFVEVKDYTKTTLYPGSNAGKQLRYLTEHANDGNSPGTFDLHITDPNNISPGMDDLINQARDAGVTVNINPPPLPPSE